MTTQPLSYEYDADRRPASGVQAIGVMGVIFAFLALVALPFTIAEYTSYGWPISGGKTAPIELWILFSTIVGFSLAAVLLMGSLGCYRLQAWGRSLLLGWSVASLIYGAAGVYFFGRWLVPSFRGEFARPAVSPLAPMCCWIVGTIFAACVMWYLTRPAAKAAFHRVV